MGHVACAELLARVMETTGNWQSSSAAKKASRSASGLLVCAALDPLIIS